MVNSYPQIILLNGTSSSGKSTIARQLQEQFDYVFLNISIDTILYTLPASDLRAMIEGRSIARAGYKYGLLVEGFHATISGLLNAGLHLIVDNAITRDVWREEFDSATVGYRVIKVGIFCDLAVAKSREVERGDRAIGTAEAEFHRVHTNMVYDLIVDTSQDTLEACVSAIVRFLS